MMEEYNINQTTLKILALYLGDYRMSLHLREIARETDVDVKAVQLQLKRLEGVNILSSILKGRNKEYRLNLNNLATKYFMMLAETFVSIRLLGKRFLIKKLMNEIDSKTHGTIVLFGSFAKGLATKESDIDLLLISDRKTGILDDRVIKEASNVVGREVSIKSAKSMGFLKGLEENDPLMREVALNHVVLKGIDDFCDLMWRYYAK